MSNKKTALYRYLKSDGMWDSYAVKDDIEQSSFDKNVFEFETGEYLILTDREAYKRAKEEIEESLWAFRPKYLEGYLKIPQKAIEVLQDKMHEDASPVFRKMLSTRQFNKLVDDAISEDGRAHFLNTYDGQQYSVTVGKTTYYIYRLN